jgi:hypothetical protein
VREPHLDLLTFSSRHLEGIGIRERPGNVSGVLMDVARDFRYDPASNVYHCPAERRARTADGNGSPAPGRRVCDPRRSPKLHPVEGRRGFFVGRLSRSPVRLAHVRFRAHNGLKPDIAALPKSAINRSGAGWVADQGAATLFAALAGC